MSLARLDTRVAKLEAKRPPMAAAPYVPPEFPPSWFARFFRVVRELDQYGPDVLGSLGWTEKAAREFMALGASDFEDFLTTYEETPCDAL